MLQETVWITYLSIKTEHKLSMQLDILMFDSCSMNKTIFSSSTGGQGHHLKKHQLSINCNPFHHRLVLGEAPYTALNKAFNLINSITTEKLIKKKCLGMILTLTSSRLEFSQ